MRQCKTEAILTNLGTFRHNQTFPGIIQAYSGILRTLSYRDIFKTVVYPKPWHIQNQKHIQNSGIFTTLVYSEPVYIQNAGIFKIWGIFRILSHIYDEALIIFTAILIFKNYNCFCKACCVAINILSWYLQRQLCYVVKSDARRSRGLRIFEILIDMFK